MKRIRARTASRIDPRAVINLMRRVMQPAGIAALGLLGLALTTLPSFGQSAYPSRPITVIVPFAAGGPTDIVARIVTGHMAATLGQQIIIENVVGSGGTTAAIRAMRSTPDGYTIMMGHMGTHGAAVALNPTVSYSPSHDFEPIGMAVGMPVLILVRKKLPAENLTEFIAYSRDHASPLTMAHAGLGSVSFATCLLFNSIIDAHPAMVAFQGTGPAMQALIAGRIDYMCDQIVSAAPQIGAGTIKSFAIASPQRSPILPDVPTAAEAGLEAFQVSAWNALFAPKRTPPTIITQLNDALGQALDDPLTRKQLLELGSEIPGTDGRTPDALTKLVNSEIVKWMPVTHSVTVTGR